MSIRICSPPQMHMALPLTSADNYLEVHVLLKPLNFAWCLVAEIRQTAWYVLIYAGILVYYRPHVGQSRRTNGLNVALGPYNA